MNEARSPAPPTAPDRATVRILLIDDDPLVRRYLERQLVAAGHLVHAVSGIRDGKKVLGAEPLDLVITDLYMPDADGLDVLDYVRAGHPSLPVLVISGRFGADSFSTTLMATAKSLGAGAVLRKPVAREQLLAAVDELVPP